MSDWPKISTVGMAGLLVTFDEKMSEPANRAALAFRAAVDAQEWSEVSETTTSLVSTFVLFDICTVSIEMMRDRIAALLETRDWALAPLPSGRRLWHVPTVYGTDLAPQLEEAARLAGMDPDQAIIELAASRVRVLTIGFAPGQPYMGELSSAWDIPRQEGLTKSVPSGALVIAIRQLIIFTNASPTGWRHIGQTAFQTFRPEQTAPFSLAPGDELIFPSVSRSEIIKIRDTAPSGNGGADSELIT